ncbi:MAG: GDSL-type esterase/lipase family protein [Bacteroidales bacterium]|nr:GDSL-type esterase/lipase family protein [Bacteroidales bacterium]HOL97580.1 GDSL-type esterase/lipase family protein [Bacteroidales bacterium]HOM36721.1 GDSL-type esterase/lipase family protein [Bacteroidales bacterium]HPD23271.1 GDSL-type esterase/lipase family protein [Bacteroidales bacterium]HRS98995.1 GDSL-type esterase/lipase family protein [Bacteroidales bacterium]
MKISLIHIAFSFYFILIATQLMAQNNGSHYYIPEQIYINNDTNFFQHYGAKNSISKFYEKIENLCLCGDEKVTILHIGASHVQGGSWSWELKKKFEELCPFSEGTPGYVFPFSIANTNHPIFYRSEFSGKWDFTRITDKELKCLVGLSGIAAFTQDSVVELKFFFNKISEIEKRKFSRIRIFSNLSDTLSYSLIVNGNTNLKNITFDTITGSIIVDFNTLQDSISVLFSKKDSINTELIFYGILTEILKPSFNFISIGINGASTSSYLKAELFDKHLSAINPDLVIFSIGVNDASAKDFNRNKYFANYQTLIDKVRNNNPNCAIILTTNTDFYNSRSGVNKNYTEVYSVMKELAEKNDCVVWNLFSVMGGEKSILLWKNDNLATKDKIHFSSEGYRIIARLMFNAFLEDFVDYLNNKVNGKF